MPLAGTASAGERLGPDHVWVPWVERKDLVPGALAPGPGPLDTDPFHCLSPPRMSIGTSGDPGEIWSCPAVVIEAAARHGRPALGDSPISGQQRSLAVRNSADQPLRAATDPPLRAAAGSAAQGRHGSAAQGRCRISRSRAVAGKAGPVGHGRSFGAAGDVELGEDVRDVDARGLGGDEQLGRDVTVAAARSDQAQYFDLPRRQAKTPRSLASGCPGGEAEAGPPG